MAFTITVLEALQPVAAEPDAGETAATGSRLGAPYPNPAGRTVVVPFALHELQRVRLRVVDLLGREVAVLVDEERAPGSHDAYLDTSRLPSGLYLLVFETESALETRKLTVLR